MSLKDGFTQLKVRIFTHLWIAFGFRFGLLFPFLRNRFCDVDGEEECGASVAAVTVSRGRVWMMERANGLGLEFGRGIFHIRCIFLPPSRVDKYGVRLGFFLCEFPATWEFLLFALESP